MSYKPRTLFRIIQDIDNSIIFLPHIQRPFVWDTDQMRRLFDSLMCNYPIQTLLFWRTMEAIKARRVMPAVEWDANLHEYYDENKSVEGVEKVFVLDGQQRIQTLYALFNGGIKSEDGKGDLEAYLDITSGDEADDDGMQYRLEFSDVAKELPWYRLRNLLTRNAQMNAEEIADDINDRLDEILKEPRDIERLRQRRVRHNCGQLVSLLREEKYFWIQELDGVAHDYPYKQILEIFVRVNSGGTKLDSGDLMFAAMKEGWVDIEQNIEGVVDLLNGSGLNFDKSFALKCILVTQGKGAELKTEKFTSREGTQLLEAIKNNWEKIEGTFEQLRDFIVQELKLYGEKVIRSYNSFVPLFDYMYHNPKPTETDRALMRGYYYKSQLFNWYGARTDSVINVVHNIVGKSVPDFPMEQIKSHFSKSREVVLEKEHLYNSRIRFIVLNMIYVEKFGGSPFNISYKHNAPHIDHIYPQSMLRSRLSLTTPEINSIGNYRFVGATDNIRKRAELPASYFSRLKKVGIDIGKHLLVPEFANSPTKLKFNVKTYRKFRDTRLEAIYKIAHRIVNPELL
ncbi:MAG: DUF262 domain-containing protein [Aestuariibacter sp.]|nr:DUF262 domain-containing protein [Aestuariibacter sp.]